MIIPTAEIYCYEYIKPIGLAELGIKAIIHGLGKPLLNRYD